MGLAMDDRYGISVKEAGLWLGCSRRTVFRLLETGHLQSFKIGSATRVTRDSLLKYVEQATDSEGGQPA